MSWTGIRTVTVHHSQIPGGSDLALFPFMFNGTYDGSSGQIDLRTVANGGNVTNSSGFDIVFASDSGISSLLKWDVKLYNPVTGETIIWVQLPTAFAASDTLIYIAFGNATVTTFQGGIHGAAWDANFQAGYHMPGTGISVSPPVIDFTSNGNDLPNISGGSNFLTSSPLGLAFSGTGQYVYASSAVNIPTGPPLTLECWFKQGNINLVMSLAGFGDNSSGGQKRCLLTAEPSLLGEQGALFAWSQDTTSWHHLAVVWPSGITQVGQALLYLDGVLQTITSSSTYTPSANAANVDIGTIPGAEGVDNWQGAFVEMRISNIARSAGWIGATYNTGISPSTFYTIGTGVLTLGCGTCNTGGVAGTAYSCQLNATGGSTPYTFSIITGSLPPGLTLNTATGAITGTPTTIGTYPYIAKVTDSLSATDTHSCSIVITSNLALACGTCNASGSVGVPYSCQLSVSGDIPADTYAIVSGALPNGLTLNASTGAITGTPTLAGNYPYTAQVTDSSTATAQAPCTISIFGACSPPVNLSPFFTNPLIIEPLSNTSTGYVAGESGSGGGFLQSFAPVLFNNKIYIVLQQIGVIDPPPTIWMYQSSDGGQTWTRLDAAHGPNRQTFDVTAGFFFDGNHTMIVAFTPTGSGFTSTLGPINLQNFDLSTGLWGSVYGTSGAPTCYFVNQAFQRPDGSILVIYNNSIASGFFVGLRAAIYSGGGWSTTFAIDTGLSGGFVSNNYCAATMDPATGDVYVFATAANPQGSGNQQVYFQLIKSDNTLGTFSVVIASGTIQYAEPVVAGGAIIVGAMDKTKATAHDRGSVILIGSPLNAPAFQSVGALATIDPSGPSLNQPFPPLFAADATGLYAAYFAPLVSDSNTVVMRLCGTCQLANPTTGWTQITAASGTGNVYKFLQFFGIARVGGNTFGTGNSVSSGFGQPTQYWLGNFVLLTCGSAPPGAVGRSYSDTLTAMFGTSPYTFSITGGLLPPGLALTGSTGVIAGTPSQAGTYAFFAQVTDAQGLTAQVPCSIVITGSVSPVDVSCADLLQGKIGVPYSEPVLASGGTGPYQYVIVSGALPPGLTLNESTGVVSGTPAATGTFEFLVGVADSTG